MPLQGTARCCSSQGRAGPEANPKVVALTQSGARGRPAESRALRGYGAHTELMRWEISILGWTGGAERPPIERGAV